MSEAEVLSNMAAPPPAAANPSDPYERQAQTFPRLSDEQVARAKAFGCVEDLREGTVLFSRGDRTVDFFLVLEGNIEIYDDGPDGAPNVFTVHGKHQFTGELELFNDRDILVGGRMGEDGRVARISRPQFRRLLQAEPDIAETIMRAFILRRVGLMQHAQGAVTLVASRSYAVGDGLRVQRFLSRNGYPLRVLDLEGDESAARAVLGANGLGADDLPVVVCGPNRVLRNPSNAELADCLGISEDIEAGAVFDVVVVGGGPSGLASAVYAASEGLRTLVLEAEAAGQAAVYLSRHARHVHVLVRGEGLAASLSDYLVGRIEASDRITLHTHTEVAALDGERHLERVTRRNRCTGAEETRPVSNLFLMLGAAPNTDWLRDCGVALDDKGFVRVGGADEEGDPRWNGRAPHMLETSRPGVFAVGDVRAGSVKRVAFSVGEGSVVVSSVHQVLAGG